MYAADINEASPNTLDGSFTPDLVLCKIWMIDEVSKIQRNFKTIYVLGSWYGNLSLLMWARSSIKFRKLANVDLDCAKLTVGQKLADNLGIGKKIIPICKDSNSLTYSMIKIPEDSLICNASSGNMQNSGWFQNIPKRTLVALQGRNNDPGSVYQYSSIKDLQAQFPLDKLLYAGHISLQDPETNYTRFMIIGIK